MKTSYLMLISLISFLTLSACEDNRYEAYEDWDADLDERISEEEFYEGVTATGYYTDWDLDDDAYLSDAELYEGYYEIWDTDNDGVIDSVEWNNAIDTYFVDYDYDTYGYFSDWDLDGDQEITLTEYSDAIVDTDFYTVWDTDDDNLVDEAEFAHGTFTYWDTDGDGYVESVEYEEWYPVYWGV